MARKAFPAGPRSRGLPCTAVHPGIKATYRTIRLEPATKTRLKELKIDPRESFNDGIARLVARAVEDEPLSDETLRRLDEADIGAGRFRLLGDVLRNPGILE